MITAPISGPIDLKGQVAIVTGAAGDIGRAVSKALVREGAIVAALDLSFKKETFSDLLNNEKQIFQYQCDITKKSQVIKVIDQIVGQHNKVDILVNCAGIVKLTSLPDISEEEWDRMFLVNVKGPFLVTQAVLPSMKKNRYGKIVNLGSVAGKAAGVAAGPHYSGSKGAVHTFTKWVARHGGPYGIYANCIAPGPCMTTMTNDFPEGSMDPEKFLLNRSGRPEDIAEAVVFLSSQASNWLTGVILDVNGGLYLS